MNTKEIKQMIDQADMEELPQLLEALAADTRSSVKKLVEAGQRRLVRYGQELERLDKMTLYEREYCAYRCICGIDEAGRGPLAGPVVAGAVVLPVGCRILYLNDSKQLSEKKREALFEQIMEQAVSVGVGIVSPARIDEINILQATYEAMRGAVAQLDVKPDILLNDAVCIPGLSVRQVPIIKGDAKSVSIAAASIVAKVTRDRMMRDYDTIYPEYGFARHKGYGSAEHIEAVRSFGPCPIHRTTFIQHIWKG